MKPEVVGFLIANLLLLGNRALSADTEESSLPGAEKRRGPVGSQYDVRRKRALSDDIKYQTTGDLVMSGTDGQHFGDSERHWNNDDRDSRHHVVRRDWGGGSDMAWIRRRNAQPKSSDRGTVVEVLAPPVSRRHGWSDTGMKWIKRRDEVAEDGPAKRRWKNIGFSWMKRHNSPTSSLDNKRLYDERLPERGNTAAANSWHTGFNDIDWIKRHSVQDGVHQID